MRACDGRFAPSGRSAEEIHRERLERLRARRKENPDKPRAIWRDYYWRNRGKILFRKKLKGCGIDPDSVGVTCG